MLGKKVQLVFAIFTFLGFVTIFSPLDTHAAPASNKLHTLTQPNGYAFQARKWGDEFYSGWETDDGYSLVFDETLKNWTYAIHDSSGYLVSSSLIVGKDALPPDIQKHARPKGKARAAIRKARALRQRGSVYMPQSDVTRIPQTGTKNILVILVNFKDTTTTYTKDDFQNTYFGTGTKGLVDYYKEVSYNQLTVSTGPGGIQGWVTVSKGHDYYGANQGDNNKDTNAGEMVSEAVKIVNDSGFDFSPYDQNNDCYVDTTAIIFQGNDEGGDGTPNDIWGHQSAINEYATNSNCSAGGKIKIFKYTAQSEKSDGQMATIGTFAHEYGHSLGLMDLYDTDYSSGGVGEWSLMAGGSNSKVTRTGDSPSHPDPWSKYYLGWITPTMVSGAMSASLDPAATSSAVYQMLAGDPKSGEYFLIENRQKTGFDASLPGAGLLVWHIDGNTVSTNYDANTINNNECFTGGPSCATQHYGVALVQADNLEGLEKKTNGGDAGDPFPGSANVTSFTDSTSPGSKLYTGTASNVSITDIAVSGDKITASLSAPQVAPAQNNCATTIPVVTPSLVLHIPIITFGTYNFWLDLTYNAATSAFAITNGGLISDMAPYGSCAASTLSSDLKLHLSALVFGSVSYWLDFQYGSAGFVITGAGVN